MRVSGEERRKQILEVALVACAENGFSGTTLDDVAEGAGVSRTLVLQHFGTKEGLYEALSEAVGRAHPLDEDVRIQRTMAEKDDQGVFLACAEHVFENNLRNAEHPNLRLTEFSMLEYPPLFHQFCGVRERAWESLISYVEDRQKDGAFKVVDPRCLVEGFRSMVFQVANEVMHNGERPDPEHFYHVIKTMIRLMLDGLRV
jgi:AcrR family transcriptional regulator